MAIRHPKVLPGRRGGVRGSGRAARPARRPRCGWRRRGVAPSPRRSSVPTCRSTSRAAAPSARPGCALPWADAGGVEDSAPAFIARKVAVMLACSPSRLAAMISAARSGAFAAACAQVTGAGSVGEALPDPAAAAGERVDPVPPRRGRAGGVTAVIQDHPRERAGPVRLGPGVIRRCTYQVESSAAGPAGTKMPPGRPATGAGASGCPGIGRLSAGGPGRRVMAPTGSLCPCHQAARAGRRMTGTDTACRRAAAAAVSQPLH